MQNKGNKVQKSAGGDRPSRNTLFAGRHETRQQSVVSMAREKAQAEKELNSYRFTSNEEPSERQLLAIMQEVAKSAQEKAAIANAKFQEGILQEVERVKAKWLS